MRIFPHSRRSVRSLLGCLDGHVGNLAAKPISYLWAKTKAMPCSGQDVKRRKKAVHEDDDEMLTCRKSTGPVANSE